MVKIGSAVSKPKPKKRSVRVTPSRPDPPLSQLKLVELAVKGKSLADKYARTKTRWFVNGELDPTNKEADKLLYAEFLALYHQFTKSRDQKF